MFVRSSYRLVSRPPQVRSGRWRRFVEPNTIGDIFENIRLVGEITPGGRARPETGGRYKRPDLIA